MYNNQVSVPRSNFGISIRANFFFRNRNFFFKFSFVFLLIRGIFVFKSLKLNTDYQKNLNIFNDMWQQIWYQGPFYDEKIMPCTIGNQIFSLKCGFGIGYAIGPKPKQWFWSYTNYYNDKTPKCAEIIFSKTIFCDRNHLNRYKIDFHLKYKFM